MSTGASLSSTATPTVTPTATPTLTPTLTPTPSFNWNGSQTSKGLSGGAIAGIAIGSFAGFCLLLGAITVLKRKDSNKSYREQEKVEQLKQLHAASQQLQMERAALAAAAATRRNQSDDDDESVVKPRKSSSKKSRARREKRSRDRDDSTVSDDMTVGSASVVSEDLDRRRRRQRSSSKKRISRSRSTSRVKSDTTPRPRYKEAVIASNDTVIEVQKELAAREARKDKIRRLLTAEMHDNAQISNKITEMQGALGATPYLTNQQGQLLLTNGGDASGLPTARQQSSDPIVSLPASVVKTLLNQQSAPIEPVYYPPPASYPPAPVYSEPPYAPPQGPYYSYSAPDASRYYDAGHNVPIEELPRRPAMSSRRTLPLKHKSARVKRGLY